MIAAIESESKTKEMYSPRQYALAQAHKHLPEMQYVCGLKYKPMFNPIVDDYYNGMVVSVPLISRALTKSLYTKRYTRNFIRALFGTEICKGYGAWRKRYSA